MVLTITGLPPDEPRPGEPGWRGGEAVLAAPPLQRVISGLWCKPPL